jgi:hypothetical protein
MDIMVTIPKTRLAQVEKEEREVAKMMRQGLRVHYFWTLGTEPTKLKASDRCYFVWDGALQAYHEVVTVAWDDEVYRWLVWLKPEIHNVEPEPMESFRGFRYRPRQEGGGTWKAKSGKR